ncbi:DUF11 domain-containing protein [Nibricoccus aquaticus]|uniref:DUF11 domain-containing protein n=1 Tax=Nibricoccus aquaticus TaxID=2576891 RepID=UPI0015869D38|nr:DUF11 domain-containing protein [Nibricoccus aquaticus]
MSTPAGAAFGSRDQTVIQAVFTLAGASPALSETLARTDLTLIGDRGEAGLVLVKTVNKTTAKPGDTILYTITYTNRAAEPLTQVIIYDATPAFTRFASAAAGALPTGMTAVNIAAPSVGASGAVKWTFTGQLNPAATGAVTFSVTVDL